MAIRPFARRFPAQLGPMLHSLYHYYIDVCNSLSVHDGSRDWQLCHDDYMIALKYENRHHPLSEQELKGFTDFQL